MTTKKEETKTASKDPKIQYLKKLANIRDSIDYIQKTGYNDFNKYYYVTEEDVLNYIRGQLKENGLVITGSAHSIDRIDNITTVGMFFTISDIETGYSENYTFYGQGQDKQDKGVYKAYTGALKYFVMKTFQIPSGDDPEKTEKAEKKTTEPPKQQKPPKKQKGDFEKAKEVIKNCKDFDSLFEIKTKLVDREWTGVEEIELTDLITEKEKEYTPFQNNDAEVPI